MLRQAGGDYFNPDEIAKRLRTRERSLTAAEANAAAWTAGVRQLDRAIRQGNEYFFETTLGGATIASRLESAVAQGRDVRIWYAGLRTPELHMARVAARVRSGGHDIAERDIRRRYDDSRRNLIRLLPLLKELKVYDNSYEADPLEGKTPKPVLVLHLRNGRIVGPNELERTPDWAKPIVARALKLAG